MESSTSEKESLCGYFSALRRWEVVKPILIVSTLLFFKEAGGHEAIVTFFFNVLEAQTGLNPRIATILYPIFLILGGLFSLCITNRCNLKLHFTISTTLQALSHLSMSIFYLVSENILRCDISLNNRP